MNNFLVSCRVVGTTWQCFYPYNTAFPYMIASLR